MPIFIVRYKLLLFPFLDLCIADRNLLTQLLFALPKIQRRLAITNHGFVFEVGSNILV